MLRRERFVGFLALALLALPARSQEAAVIPPHKVPFVYYLQNVDRDVLARVDPAVAVIDPYDSKLGPEDIAWLQQRYGQTLLAYLSIGEADPSRTDAGDGYAFRPEWRRASWYSGVPEAVRENDAWRSRRVEYWSLEWRAILLYRLKRLAALGYDGAMFDTADSYLAMQPHYRRDIAQDMADLVACLAAEARAVKPGFRIVLNNAMGLYDYKDSRSGRSVLEIIDGQLKEDTWYNENGFLQEEWTEDDLAYLRRALKAGKPVYAVDYFTGDNVGVPDKRHMTDFMARARGLGAIPYAADRGLGKFLSFNEDYYRDGVHWDAAKKAGVHP